jgi:hypothetical protein
MKKHHHNDDEDVLHDGQRLHVPMFAMDSPQRGASPHLPRVHDGTGDSGLAMHRPGFRVSDALPSEELQCAHAAYVHELTTAHQRVGKESAVLDARRPSGKDAIPTRDVEIEYRLYSEEISQAWRTPR